MDRRKRETLTLVREADGYAEERRRSGALRLHTVPGFRAELAWLFADDRPNEVDLLNAMLASSED